MKESKLPDAINGYALAYLLADGEQVCPHCANGIEEIIVGHKIIWYNSNECCGYCKRRLG